MSAIAIINQPRALSGLAVKPPSVFLPDEKAGERFFGFFTAHIRNRNTRRAYYKAASRFSDWCESRGLDLAHMKPPHVAAYIESLGLPEPNGQGLSKPTVKQHLAALRMLFDWLVVGHVLDSNPAHAVRGPKYSEERQDARARPGGSAGAAGGDRHEFPHRPARSRANRYHDLHLRAYRRGAADECRGLFFPRSARVGPAARKGRQGA
jgi:hypothetical protein